MLLLTSFFYSGMQLSRRRLWEDITAWKSRKDYCYLYTDDHLNHSGSFEDYLDRLDRVYTALGEAGMKVNSSRCIFGANLTS